MPRRVLCHTPNPHCAPLCVLPSAASATAAAANDDDALQLQLLELRLHLLLLLLLLLFLLLPTVHPSVFAPPFFDRCHSPKLTHCMQRVLQSSVGLLPDDAAPWGR